MTKKIFKYAMFIAVALATNLSLTSCGSDDDDDPVVDPTQLSEKEQAMKDLTAQYVNNVVFPIYTSLADQTDKLFNQLVEAKAKFSLIGYAQLDLGIAKYHFEVGAGKENFEWA